VHYFITADSTDTLNYVPDSDVINTYMKGFGLIGYGGSFDAFAPRLNGVVIDGILYGDTTCIVTAANDFRNNLPFEFSLK